MSTTACERCEANHEEMETGERHHVDGQLAKVRVKLTRETEASSDTGHDRGDKVVKISVGWVGKFEGAHANVVERLDLQVSPQVCRKICLTNLIIDTEGLIRVLDQLMH